jgi:hypothetical protein
MNQDEGNNPEHSSTQSSGDPVAKVLPFRRPSPQPTMARRAGGMVTKGAPEKSGRGQKPGQAAWKTKAAHLLQGLLLAGALLLALKNCGKI